MIRRPPNSTQSRSSAASGVYKGQVVENDRRNSGVPLLDMKDVKARIEPGSIIREKVTIGEGAVIMMGAIINIGSVAGLTPDTSQLAYGTSKAGIIHMSKMIAVHAAMYNVTCNVVCPGMTATEAVKNNLSPEFQEFFLKHTPIRRMGEPQEIADAVLYLADAGFTTGQVIAVHGGFGIPTPVYGDMLMMKNKR